MQINGGKNDRFVAFADKGALVVGHYATDEKNLPLWRVARKYTLADNFFMGAFGGSYLAHFWLICSCTPTYPNADQSPAKGQISIVEPDGTRLKLADNSPRSALDGPPKFVRDGALTPDFYSVNTMQPPYQPSAVKPAKDGNPLYADPAKRQHPAACRPGKRSATCCRPGGSAGRGTAVHGSRRSTASRCLRRQSSSITTSPSIISPPGRREPRPAPSICATAASTAMSSSGRSTPAMLPPVTSSYKPQGNLNEHPAYADVLLGDRHILELVNHLEKSPQWSHMLVVITYDENGGFWDHVAPPKADRWGPGSRIPAFIVSPFAQARLRRPLALRHDIDPALHHPPLRPAEPAGHHRP